jgi:hypothetical protein
MVSSASSSGGSASELFSDLRSGQRLDVNSRVVRMSVFTHTSKALVSIGVKQLKLTASSSDSVQLPMISPPLPVHLDCRVSTQAAVAASTFWTSSGKAMCWFDLLRTWVACETSVRWSGARRMRVVLNFGIEVRMDDFEIGTCHHLTPSNPTVTVQHPFCHQEAPCFTHNVYVCVQYNSGVEQPLFCCRVVIGWWL